LEQQAPSLLDFALEQSVKTAESSTMEGRIQSVDEILRILQKSEHPIEREERIRLVAERFGINQQRLIDRYPALREKHPPRSAVSKSESRPVTSSKGAPEERDLIYLLLHGQLSAADVAHIQGCLETIDRKQAEAVLRDVITQLKAAEREGRIEDVRMLNARVNEMRLQKAGRPLGVLSLVKGVSKE
jgi:DNA primase